MCSHKILRFTPFLAALGIAQAFGLALLSLAQEVIQILVVGIESGLVHYLIAQLPAESGEGGSACLVVVKVTGNYRIVREDSQCFADIGDGVENYRIGTVI